MLSLPRLKFGLLLLLAGINGGAWLLHPPATSAASPSLTQQQKAVSSTIPSALIAPPPGPGGSQVFEHAAPHPELTISRGPQWRSTHVNDGESLAAVFKREGIAPKELAYIVQTDHGRALAKVRSGATLQYQIDNERHLTLLRYPQSRLQTLLFTRAASDRFVVNAEMRKPDVRLVSTHGTVKRTLIASAKSAGLSTQTTIALAKVFQWDIDFALDIHPGDSFSVVYQSEYLDGEHIGDGPIIAAEFVNHGRRYQAIRFVDSAGEVGYFTPDGRSLHKAFLRAPLEFNRVSSNFSMRRMHPITGIVRPHLGIDYAAPTGTPVWAAGDGRVALAATDATEGRHIVIAHGGRYQTRYLHLSAFARGVRPGEKVRQGQIIGYVGQTGLATGPHLHFEFLEGGLHKNPGNVALMDNPIATRERGRFAALSGNLLAVLDGAPTNHLALNLASLAARR